MSGGSDDLVSSAGLSMCVDTAHIVDAADQTVGPELRNRATSRASIACMRVTLKTRMPCEENPTF